MAQENIEIITIDKVVQENKGRQLRLSYEVSVNSKLPSV